jgi:hypothetical protein
LQQYLRGKFERKLGLNFILAGLTDIDINNGLRRYLLGLKLDY